MNQETHHYNPATLLYTHSTELSISAGYTNPLVPQCATLSPLPSYDPNTQVLKIDINDKTWQVLDKCVEVTAYNKQTQEQKEFEDKSLVTDDYTLEVPFAFCEWSEADQGWVESISLLREDKKQEIRMECEKAINAGFTVDVLFPECNYRNDRDQQITIRNASETSGGGKIWMNESFVQHTKTEALAVYSKSKSEIERHRTNYAGKCVYLNDPDRTIDEIKSVIWGSVE